MCSSDLAPIERRGCPDDADGAAPDDGWVRVGRLTSWADVQPGIAPCTGPTPAVLADLWSTACD